MKPNQSYSHIHQFLKQHPMGVLSTVSEDGKPWGAAIYYVADEDFNFFFVTRANTFKYKNLDKNALAALTVADEDEQTTVQVSGTITRVPPEDYMDVVFKKLETIKPKGDYNWSPPLLKVHKGDYMPLQLTPSKLQYANYKKFSSDIHHDYIENII